MAQNSTVGQIAPKFKTGRNAKSAPVFPTKTKTPQTSARTKKAIIPPARKGKQAV
jgi:hypothetical protein